MPENKITRTSTSSCESLYDVVLDGETHRLRLWIITGGTPALCYADYRGETRRYPEVEKWNNAHWNGKRYKHQTPTKIEGPDLTVLPRGEEDVYEYIRQTREERAKLEKAEKDGKQPVNYDPETLIHKTLLVPAFKFLDMHMVRLADLQDALATAETKNAVVAFGDPHPIIGVSGFRQLVDAAKGVGPNVMLSVVDSKLVFELPTANNKSTLKPESFGAEIKDGTTIYHVKWMDWEWKQTEMTESDEAAIKWLMAGAYAPPSYNKAEYLPLQGVYVHNGTCAAMTPYAMRLAPTPAPLAGYAGVYRLGTRGGVLEVEQVMDGLGKPASFPPLKASVPHECALITRIRASVLCGALQGVKYVKIEIEDYVFCIAVEHILNAIGAKTPKPKKKGQPDDPIIEFRLPTKEMQPIAFGTDKRLVTAMPIREIDAPWYLDDATVIEGGHASHRWDIATEYVEGKPSRHVIIEPGDLPAVDLYWPELLTA